MADDRSGRPDIMAQLSTTQVGELEQQFAEGDRQAWDRLCQEYGWSTDQGQQVWDWFQQRPGTGQAS